LEDQYQAILRKPYGDNSFKRDQKGSDIIFDVVKKLQLKAQA
jgi:hypothetical protein